MMVSSVCLNGKEHARQVRFNDRSWPSGRWPAVSAKRRDRERRHYPVGHVRDEGVDHDARPAIQSEKSHTAHRHEDEIQRRDRREKVNEAHGIVTAFQPPQDKAERDAPYPAPDKRPVHVRRRERQRRRDP